MDVPGSTTFIAFVSTLAALFGANLALWLVLGGRLAAGQPVLPYQRRRRVPWGGLHVLAVFVLYAAVPAGLQWLDMTLLGTRPPSLPNAGAAETVPSAPSNPSQARRNGTPDSAHPLIVLMGERRSAAVLLLAVAVAVVAAPIAEEFFFRLLLQGWLESLERRLRRWSPAVRRLPGLLPVGSVAILFAAVHVRVGPPPTDADWLVHVLAVYAVAETVTVLVGVGLIWSTSGAGAVDFGFVPSKFWPDVRLGVLAFVAMAVPIFAIKFALQPIAVHEPALAPIVDPVALLPLALALGVLYYRTHRIVPSIVMHMALNATSLWLLWLATAGQ